MNAIRFDLEKIKQKDERELNRVANAMAQRKLTPGQVGLLKHQGKEVMALIRQMVDTMRQSQEVAFKASSYKTRYAYQSVENISRSRIERSEKLDAYLATREIHEASLRSNERMNEDNNTKAALVFGGLAAIGVGLYFGLRKK